MYPGSREQTGSDAGYQSFRAASRDPFPPWRLRFLGVSSLPSEHRQLGPPGPVLSIPTVVSMPQPTVWETLVLNKPWRIKLKDFKFMRRKQAQVPWLAHEPHRWEVVQPGLPCRALNLGWTAAVHRTIFTHTLSLSPSLSSPSPSLSPSLHILLCLSLSPTPPFHSQ